VRRKKRAKAKYPRNGKKKNKKQVPSRSEEENKKQERSLVFYFLFPFGGEKLYPLEALLPGDKGRKNRQDRLEKRKKTRLFPEAALPGREIPYQMGTIVNLTNLRLFPSDKD
jgi:hypothetical protein